VAPTHNKFRGEHIMNTDVNRRALSSIIKLTLATAIIMTGLVLPGPSAQAQDKPAPMSHTIDYVFVSTPGDTSNPTTTYLENLTKQVSDHWNRMSRGVVSEIRVGQVVTIPNYPSASAFCDWRENTIPDIVATALGHSLDVYKSRSSGRTLALIGPGSCGASVTLASGTGLSSGGIIQTHFHVPVVEVAHELGHAFGLAHASATPQECLTEYWDGPYSTNTQVLAPDACGMGANVAWYGDDSNVMGSPHDEPTMDLNGQQKYQLGLIQPGAGIIQVTAAANEQRITVHDTHTPDLNLPQTIWMTADDPDGPGGCSAPEYGIEYDPAMGGVRVYRIATLSDCSTKNLLANLNYPHTIAWPVPVSATKTNVTKRAYLLPGESRLTQSGNVEVKVISTDPASGTATVSIRRTDVPGVTSLQVTSNSLGPSTTITALNQQLTGKVTTNQASWSASSNQSWATVTPSGTPGQNITVSVGANPTTAERTATITVRAGSSTTTMNLVQQSGNDALANDCAASTATTCAWADLTTPLTGTIDVGGDLDWFKITPTMTGTYVFTSNRSEAPLGYIGARMYDAAGNWLVSVSRDDPSQVTLSAYLVAGETYFLEVSGYARTGAYKLTATTTASLVTVSPMKLSTPGGPDTLTFQINTSLQWSLDVPKWLTATQTSGTGPTEVTLTITANATGEPRTGRVAVYAGGQAVGVTVAQEYNDDCGSTVTLHCTWVDISKPVTGTINYVGDVGDIDWFKFTAPTTGTWVITSSGAAPNPGVAYSKVLATDGTVVGNSVRAGDRFTITTFLEAGRAYYLSMSWSVWDNPGNYVVSAALSDNVYLTLSPARFDWPGEGGTGTIEIDTNGAWRADTSDWVTVNPSSGDGPTRVTVSAPPNTTGAMRTNTLGFYAGDQVRWLIVTEKYVTEPILAVSQTSVNMAAGGSTQGVEVTASGDWTATGPSWVSVSPPSGNGNTSVRITSTENTTGQTRTDKVTFTSGSKTAAVDITQPASASLSLSTQKVVFGAPGGAQTMELTSNGSWSVAMFSENHAVQLDKTSGTGNATLTLTMPPNYTGYSRNETITFWGGGKVVSVFITQPSGPPPVEILSVSPGSVNAAAAGDTQPVQITASGSWQLTAPSWVTASRTSGTGNASVDLTMTANTTGQPRVGNVTITSGSKTANVTVAQPAVRDDCGNTAASNCAWANLSTAVTGSLEYAGDKDWYRFVAPNAGTYNFTASQTATQPVLNTAGKILGSDGSTVVASDSSAASSYQFRISAVLAAGQTYYLEVSGTGTGNYSVAATVPETNTLSLSTTAINAGDGGAWQWVQVTSNTDWSVTGPDWTNVGPSSGRGNGWVSVSVYANVTGSARMGQIVFTAGTKVVSLVISQPAQPLATYLNCAITAIPAAPGGTTVPLMFYTDGPWGIRTPDWVTASQTAGTKNGNVGITVAPNTTGSPRSGWITIITYSSTAWILVTQS